MCHGTECTDWNAQNNSSTATKVRMIAFSVAELP